MEEVLTKGNVALNDTAYLGGISVGSSAANTSLINANDNTRDISIEVNNSTISAAQTKGVFSNITGTGAGDKYAVYGSSSANNGDKYGVYAEASGNGNTKYGIYGTASGTGTNWAGYFDQGSVYVNNNLGIGVTVPLRRLEVGGDAYIDSIWTDSIIIGSGANELRIGGSPGVNGDVLTYNNGNAEWALPSADSDWDTTITTNYLYNLDQPIYIGDTNTGLGIGGKLNVITSDSFGVSSVISGTSPSIQSMSGLFYNLDQSAVADAYGLAAASVGVAGYKTGVWAIGRNGDENTGVLADAETEAGNQSDNNYGVRASASGGDTNFAVYAQAGSGVNSDSTVALYATATGSNGVHYAGVFDQGKVQIKDTLQLPYGSSNGYVLTSDATGNATWEVPSNGLWDTTGNTVHSADTTWSLGIGTTSTQSDIQIGDAIHLFDWDNGGDKGLVSSYNINDSGLYTKADFASLMLLFNNGIQFISADSMPAGTVLDLDTIPSTSVAVKLGGVGINVDNPNYALDVQPVNDSLAIYVRPHTATAGVIAMQDVVNNFNVGLSVADTLLSTYKIVLPDTAPLPGQVLQFNASLGRLEWQTIENTTCPSGYSQVNSNFCIETSAHTGDNWFQAADTCTANQATLPSWAEWYSGTQVVGVDWSGTNTWEWLDQASQNNASIVGGGAGATTNDERMTVSADDPISPSNTIQYRCVYHIKN
ncbi:MAG: hypothetical protein HQ500_03170 [Flavobacteriales bacterium]|nr:hypothetical protein [Flavobacteriales bacterium]